MACPNITGVWRSTHQFSGFDTSGALLYLSPNEGPVYTLFFHEFGTRIFRGDMPLMLAASLDACFAGPEGYEAANVVRVRLTGTHGAVAYVSVAMQGSDNIAVQIGNPFACPPSIDEWEPSLVFERGANFAYRFEQQCTY